MRFSGRLQLEADPLNWVKTDLLLGSGRLELTAGSDVLGSWATSQVKATRVEGDRFELQLGDDRAVFAADDALAFSYEAMPVLTKRSMLSAASGLRGKLRKGLNGLERPEVVEVESPKAESPRAESPKAEFLVPSAPEPEPAAVAEERPLGPTARKLRELMEAAKSAQATAATVPEPAADPLTAVPPPAPDLLGEPVVDPPSADPPPSEYGSDDPPWEGAMNYLSSVGSLAPLRDEGGSSRLGLNAPVPFRWARAEAGPLVGATKSRVVEALEDLIDEVRAGSMSASQIEAVTRLVEAVGEVVERHSAD
ncbi:MAG TPA: hypothetical protein VLA54_00445 [Acidimicrobiia bacterium]|nr:hypothetical protein [Acidimicrobiia bacterium]